MNEPNGKLLHSDVTTLVLQEIIDTPEKYDEKDSIKTAGSYDRAILNAQILLELADGNSAETVAATHKESILQYSKDESIYIVNLKTQVKKRGIAAIYPSPNGAKSTPRYTVNSSPLTVNPVFQNLLTALTAAEFDSLKKTIIADEKITHPIVIWNNQIVDGHNRYRISQETGIPFTIEKREFETEQDAIDWIVNNQLSRRNLKSRQISFIIGSNYNVEKGSHGGNRKSKAQNELLKSGLSTSVRLAEKFDVSKETVKRFGKFAEALNVVGRVSDYLKSGILAESIKGTDGVILHLAILSPDDIIKIEAMLKADSNLSLSKAISTTCQPTPTTKQKSYSIKLMSDQMFEFFDPTIQSREEIQDELVLALREYRLTHHQPTSVEIAPQDT
jgi:hypothetical protein